MSFYHTCYESSSDLTLTSKNMTLIFLQKILKLSYLLCTSDKKNCTQQGRTGHFDSCDFSPRLRLGQKLTFVRNGHRSALVT